jgi:hypothetical protein
MSMPAQEEEGVMRLREVCRGNTFVDSENSNDTDRMRDNANAFLSLKRVETWLNGLILLGELD